MAMASMFGGAGSSLRFLPFSYATLDFQVPLFSRSNRGSSKLLFPIKPSAVFSNHSAQKDLLRVSNLSLLLPSH
jgi:hypothetical protein